MASPGVKQPKFRHNILFNGAAIRFLEQKRYVSFEDSGGDVFLLARDEHFQGAQKIQTMVNGSGIISMKAERVEELGWEHRERFAIENTASEWKLLSFLTTQRMRLGNTPTVTVGSACEEKVYKRGETVDPFNKLVQGERKLFNRSEASAA